MNENRNEQTALEQLEALLIRAIDIDNLPMIELLEAKINQIRREQQ